MGLQGGRYFWISHSNNQTPKQCVTSTNSCRPKVLGGFQVDAQDKGSCATQAADLEARPRDRPPWSGATNLARA